MMNIAQFEIKKGSTINIATVINETPKQAESIQKHY